MATAVSADDFLDGKVAAPTVSADDFLDGKISAATSSPGLFARTINKVEQIGHDIWTGIGGDAAGYRATTMDTSPEARAAASEAQQYGGYSPEATAAGSEATLHAGSMLGGGLVGGAAGVGRFMIQEPDQIGGGIAGLNRAARAAAATQRHVSQELTYQPTDPNSLPATESFDTAAGLPAAAIQRYVANPAKSVMPSAGPTIDYFSQLAPMLIDPALRGVGAVGRAATRMTPTLAARSAAVGEGASPALPPLGATSAPGTGMGSAQSMGAAAVDQGALGYDPLSQPVKGGLPPEAEAARVKALQDVGITEARASAITGDAAQAAVDANIAKFEKEPAGRAAGAHFQQHETGPLTQYAQDTITEQGGSLGLDEDALYRRGNIIATPFDRFRDWLSAQIDGLYTEARNRGSQTAPTQLGRLNELLNGTTPESLDFQGQLGASQDGERLLGAARSKLERDLAANPQGLNATQAENTRKFFNSDGVWTSDRSWAINRMHQAMDFDVAEAAGEDVFDRARQAYQVREQLLNDPRGILKLFDKDPNTPINRATPFQKLPDALINLDPDQLQHVMSVLQDMQHIPELAPDANAALGEIRGHYVNRVLEQGSMTRGGAGVGRTPKPYWDADAVNKYLADSGRRRGIIFDGAAGAETRIENLQNAGNVLKVDPSYRGAAAQASTALKSGLASALFEHAGPWVGEAIGSMLGAPGLGGIAGSYGGRALAVRAAEARGLSGWNQGIRDIGEAPPQPPRAPPGEPPPPGAPPGSAPLGGPPPGPAGTPTGGGAAPPPAQPPSPRAQEVAATMSRLRTWDQPAATRAEHTRRLQQVAEESPEVSAAVGPRPSAPPPNSVGGGTRPMTQDQIAQAMANRQPMGAVPSALPVPPAVRAASTAPRTMAPAATRSEPVVTEGEQHANRLGLTDPEVDRLIGPGGTVPPGMSRREYAGLIANGSPVSLSVVRGSNPAADMAARGWSQEDLERIGAQTDAARKQQYEATKQPGESYEDWLDRMAQEEERRQRGARVQPKKPPNMADILAAAAKASKKKP